MLQVGLLPNVHIGMGNSGVGCFAPHPLVSRGAIEPSCWVTQAFLMLMDPISQCSSTEPLPPQC